MVRQVIPLLIASFAVLAVAEPLRLRLRRQATSGNETSSSSSFPMTCPVQCGRAISQDWAKAVGFNAPTQSMVTRDIGDSATFSIMCGIYSEYRNCLQRCAIENPKDFQPILDVSPLYSQVCTSRQTDFDTVQPCLSNHTKSIRTACQKENDNLYAAAVRLSPSTKFELDAPREYCKNAVTQLYCVFPIVNHACGEAPINLIRSLANATMVGLRQSIDFATLQSMYPDCVKYFQVLDDGIQYPTEPTNVTTSTTTMVSMDNSTMNNSTTALNSTTQLFNTTTPDSKRDDPYGPTYPSGGRFAGHSLAPTTTPSMATKIGLNNFLALFIFSMLFVFSCQ
jgi:hypothetical protein